MSPNPSKPFKLFICHASEDKSEYAEPLYKLLRSRGVDAWMDKYEIFPGDSLVRKIFEDGLGLTDSVMILLSAVSVTKPWVKAELDLSKIRQIEDKVRLIPVRLDDCQVPECLRSTLWIDAKAEGSLERVAEKIVATLYGADSRPPIGVLPAYENASMTLTGLDPVDINVLSTVLLTSLPSTIFAVGVSAAWTTMEAQGMSYSAFQESLHMLCETGYLRENIAWMPDEIALVDIPPHVLKIFAKEQGIEIEVAERIVGAEIANNDLTDISVAATRLELPRGLVEAIVTDFESQKFVELVRCVNGSVIVVRHTVAFTRWIRSISA